MKYCLSHVYKYLIFSLIRSIVNHHPFMNNAFMVIYFQKLLFNSFKSQNMNPTRSNTLKHWRLTRHVSQLWELFHYLCTAKLGIRKFTSEHSWEILYILVIYKISIAITGLRFPFSWRKPKLKHNNLQSSKITQP